MERFIRINELMSITGLAKSTVWLWVKQGRLPAGRKLSPRVTVWYESEIITFMGKAA